MVIVQVSVLRTPYSVLRTGFTYQPLIHLYVRTMYSICVRLLGVGSTAAPLSMKIIHI